MFMVWVVLVIVLLVRVMLIKLLIVRVHIGCHQLEVYIATLGVHMEGAENQGAPG